MSTLPNDAAAHPHVDDAGLAERLDRIEQLLQALVEQRTIKEWYTPAEVAKILGKAEFTVREWCRLGRIQARKKNCGRGVAGEWIMGHEELTRIRNEGLLPEANPYRHVKSWRTEGTFLDASATFPQHHVATSFIPSNVDSTQNSAIHEVCSSSATRFENWLFGLSPLQVCRQPVLVSAES